MRRGAKESNMLYEMERKKLLYIIRFNYLIVSDFETKIFSDITFIIVILNPQSYQV